MPQSYAVDPAQMLVALGLGLLLAGAVAAVYTVIAWRLGRRRGRNGLLLGWAAATTALTTLAALSAIRNLAVIRPVAARDVLSFFGLYLLVFGAGLGGVTWVVSRRLARFPLPTARAGTVALGVLGFFVALLLLCIPVLIWDASRLF